MNGLVIVFGVPALLFLASVLEGYRNPLPPTAPQAPQDASDAGEWLALPFQLVAGLAGLLWLAIAALVFVSPVLALAWLVLR